jgi:uncharacterized repeat protein (TIGR01451 family)
MKLTRKRAALVAALTILAAAPQAFAVGTPAGTVISNQATVNYTDTNGNPLSALSNIVTTTVSQVATVSVTPNNSSNAVPGNVLFYAHIVKNLGNGPDTIDMTAVSGGGFATALFFDNNANGIFDAGDTPMTDTDADGVPDTGSLAANAQKNILARITIPVGTAPQVDVMTVTGTSSFNVAVSSQSTDTTTILAPNVTATKSVLPAGNQPPGTTLTYTLVVNNAGSANALTVKLTDPIPANTTYVPGSITLDGVSKTDVADLDQADFNATTPGAVTVNIGAMAAAASHTITFKVTIN